jgi:hypothetical protein
LPKKFFISETKKASLFCSMFLYLQHNKDADFQ